MSTNKITSWFLMMIISFIIVAWLKHFKLTVHAQGRFAERGIDIDHVKSAIERPDQKKLDTEGIKVQKKIGNKTIVVVYSEEKFSDKHGIFLIVTAYYK